MSSFLVQLRICAGISLYLDLRRKLGELGDGTFHANVQCSLMRSYKQFFRIENLHFFQFFSHVLIIKGVTKSSRTYMSFAVPSYTYKNTSEHI